MASRLWQSWAVDGQRIRWWRPTRRSTGRFRRRSGVEILEGRLCLSGSLTLSLGDLSGTVGSPYDQTVEVSAGNPGDAYPFTLLPPQGGAPATASLSLNGTTGEISGTPLAPGAYPFVVSVTDTTQDLTAAEAFPLSINPLIALTGSVNATGTENSAYQSGTITATGSPSGPYTFQAQSLSRSFL